MIDERSAKTETPAKTVPASGRIRRVLAVLPAVIPSAFIYIIRPLTALANQGRIEFRYLQEKNAQPEDFAGQDLIIFPRNQEPRFSPQLEEIRAAGTAAVYDLDDNFWEIPQHLDVGRSHLLPPRMKMLEHYLKNTDLVRVYNPLVAERVRAYNPNVFQAVPGIDFSLVPAAPEPKPDDRIRIVYMTARGAEDPLAELFLPDLADVLRIYPDQVEAVFWRERPPALNGLPNVTVMPVEYDYEAFLRGVSRAGYDIGLAPILNNRFYISKTNTKFRDYGACRIAGIYSRAPIYSQDIVDGQTGLVINQGPGAWRDAMLRLINNPSLRASIQEAAYQYVYDHFRQEIMEEEWLAVFDRLSPRRLLFPPAVVNAGQDGVEPWRVEAPAAPQTGLRGLSIRSAGSPPLPGFQEADFDLNQPFPFPDGWFDLVYAADPLTGVDDLMATMREIQRVSRHGAQVCIYVPYMMHHQSLAHPRSRQLFNEHTPRYWTRAANTPVYSDIYASEHLEGWGLLDTISSEAELDLRCQKITFFYTHEYRGQSEEQKRLARQKQWNVCDRILFHLVVVKQPVTGEELNALEHNLDIYVPPEVTFRQYQEQLDSQKEELDQVKTELYIRLSELENLRKKQAAEIDEALRQREEEIVQARLEQERLIHQQEAQVERLQGEVHRLLEQNETERISRGAEIERLREQLRNETEKHRAQLAAKQGEVQYYEYKSRDLINKVTRIRNNRLYHFSSRLSNHSSAWDLLSPAYQALKEDSAARCPGGPAAYLLQPGKDLWGIDYVQYELQFGRPGLREIQLAVVLDIPLKEGILGIELANVENLVLARAMLPAVQVTEQKPVSFQFRPVSETAQGLFYLRVYARETKVPVRLFELRPRTGLGFIFGQPRPFACFGFMERG